MASRAICHNIRDFTARVLATLPDRGPVDFRRIAKDMTIGACQNHSELSSDTIIVYVN
jgi:hypothetical protein